MKPKPAATLSAKVGRGAHPSGSGGPAGGALAKKRPVEGKPHGKHLKKHSHHLADVAAAHEEDGEEDAADAGVDADAADAGDDDFMAAVRAAMGGGADGAASDDGADDAAAPASAGAGSGGFAPASGHALNAAHTTAAAVAEYAAAFASGAPFPHLALRDVFDADLLTAVRAELLAGLEATTAEDAEAPGGKKKAAAAGGKKGSASASGGPRPIVYRDKRNDLYDFRQTDDLRCVTGTATAALRDCVYSPQFRQWMKTITGIETEATVDIFAAAYGDGSHLLCHDDDLARRRIAYIIYLVPPGWDTDTDGGSLDLFSTDPSNPCCADAITRRLAPEWNSIAFFEVSARSHHQVAEVLSAAKGPRLSISGWLYGAPVPRPPPPPPPPVRFIMPRAAVDRSEAALDDATGSSKGTGKGSGSGVVVAAPSPLMMRVTTLPDGRDDVVGYWVNPTYTRPGVMAQVAAQFASAGSILLPGFLRMDRFAAALASLGTQPWRHVGPANMRSYAVAADTAWGGPETRDDDALAAAAGSMRGGAAGGLTLPVSSSTSHTGLVPSVADRLFRFLTGRAMMAYVAAVTVAAGSSGKAAGRKSSTATASALVGVSGQARCFTRGSYTLISDPDYKAGLKRAKAAKVTDTNPGVAPESLEDDASAAGAGAAATSGGKRPRPAAAAAGATAASGGGSSAKRARTASADDDGEEEEEEEDGAVTPTGAPTLVDATLCLTTSSEPWPDKHGGYVSYLTADEELLSVPPTRNALSLVLRPPGVMSFVKYVTHHAAENRYDVALQYLVGSSA